jgi:hypothetical protein
MILERKIMIEILNSSKQKLSETQLKSKISDLFN